MSSGRVTISRLLWAGLLVLGASASAAGQVKVIAEGDTWRYFKGTEQPPAEWNTIEFDDSTWLEGETPIGYSTDLEYRTVLDDMMQAELNPGYWSVFARKTFTLSLAEVKAIKLLIKIDDGFVAYINGIEVARFGFDEGAEVAFDTPAAASDFDPPTWQAFNLSCDDLWQLQDGENVLAIQGSNASMTSSDFSFDPELESFPEICPSNLTCTYTETTNRVTLRWNKTKGIPTYESFTLLRNGKEVTPGPAPAALAFTDRNPLAGSNTYALTATYCGADCPALTCTVFAGAEHPSFRRGDADANGVVNLGDPVAILGFLFRGTAMNDCEDAADANDDGMLNVGDPVRLLRYLFQGDPAPPEPFDPCGQDATADALDCASTGPCP